MVGRGRMLVCPMLWAWCALSSLPANATENLYPVAGGTLADGGGLGTFDGVADDWNWEFGPSGFAGAVTLTTETAISTVEHRIVLEYDLRAVELTAPIEATLSFTIRGARAFPFPDMNLHVYSYPADLLESPGDFSGGPSTLLGVFVVSAMQDATETTLDVSDLVASLLSGGNKKAAFRFQIDPNTPHVANQVFINMLDTDPSTIPLLTIRSALPGDADDDSDVDLNDFAIFVDCMGGPGASSTPNTPGMLMSDCLRVFNRDDDSDVDLHDLSMLLGHFSR